MNQQTLKDQINGTSKESTDPQDQIIRTLDESKNFKFKIVSLGRRTNQLTLKIG